MKAWAFLFRVICKPLYENLFQGGLYYGKTKINRGR